jgi:hypothetical protein
VKNLRRHLTYANVMSTLLAFIVLTGATAFAAQQLGKKTVGVKQLKSNAVTTAKIKKNAVTKAKIKAGAVDGSKIADGSVTGTDINSASTPFGRIVFEARGTSTVALPNKAITIYPLANSTYTQEAGSDNSYVGAVDVTLSSGCKEARNVAAFLTIDALDPLKPTSQDIVAWGIYEDESSSQLSTRINLGPYLFGGTRFQPSSPTNHTLALTVQGQCKTGSGISATAGSVDVIGTKK